MAGISDTTEVKMCKRFTNYLRLTQPILLSTVLSARNGILALTAYMFHKMPQHRINSRKDFLNQAIAEIDTKNK